MLLGQSKNSILPPLINLDQSFSSLYQGPLFPFSPFHQCSRILPMVLKSLTYRTTCTMWHHSRFGGGGGLLCRTKLVKDFMSETYILFDFALHSTWLLQNDLVTNFNNSVSGLVLYNRSTGYELSKNVFCMVF